MKLSKCVKECQENGVLKNLSIYIVSSWVFLQVIALIAEPLGFSMKIVAYCLIILLIGFPLYIFGVWKYQLAPNVKRKPLLDEEGAPIPGKFRQSKFQRLYFSFMGVVGVICISIALFILNNNMETQQLRSEWDGSDKIAVLRFKNRMVGDTAKTNIIGEMAVDWIIHGITRNNLAQVISPEIIDDYSKVLRASLIDVDNTALLRDHLKPSRIIEGDYYQDGDQLIFQCSITDEVMDRTLISFEPVSCDSDSPLDCIEALNQRILGYFVIAEKKEENVEARPPKFEAYETFRKALTLRNDGGSIYLDSLQSAIAKDPDFFEPRIYRFMYFFNQGDYATADSLLTGLRLRTGMHPRQRLLLDLYDAMLKGDHRNTYRYQQEEYNITPFHMETNSNMMVFSLQLVNRPEGVDSIYRQIDMEKADLTKCAFCIERYKIRAMAHIELGEYEEAVALLSQPARENFEDIWILKKILIRAQIRAGDLEGAQNLLASLIAPRERPDLLPETQLFAALEFLRAGKNEKAFELLDQAIEAYTESRKRGYDEVLADYRLGQALFYRESYARALPYLQDGYEGDSLDFNYGALYAISLEKTGRPEQAEALLDAMRDFEPNFQYGELDYSLAQYYAATGQRQACLENLLKAISAGHWYETGAFGNDPLLRDYYETPEFRKVMTYWQ